MSDAKIDQAMQTALRHHQAGRLSEAQAIYRQILAHQSEHADALHLLGVADFQLGQLDSAADLIRRAIAANPKFAEYHFNLGNVLYKQGRFDLAIAAYEAAVKLRPDYADALYNLANAILTVDRIDDAIETYNRALKARPEDPKILDSLGRALKDNGCLDEAIAAFRRTIQLKPDFAECHSNLVYAVHFHSAYGPADLLGEAKDWANLHERPLGRQIPRHSIDPTLDRRLKIGYVSADLRSHPVARFLLPLLKNHDPQNVETICYSTTPRPDEMTAHLKQAANTWRDCPHVSDADLARQIREDHIDILIDLSLHTPGNRLRTFAQKPAPVQATWLGYAGTTGLSRIDYRITDPYLDPSGTGDEFYSEQSIRLQNCFWCYQPPPGAPEVNALPAASGNPITFGSFNHFTKISNQVLDLWAKILNAIPNSRMVIHAHRPAHQTQVLSRFARGNIEPSRTKFVGILPFTEYLTQYHQVDIALDTVPYGGGTITCDALWMGVPTITLRGQTAVGRGGVSILSNIGLTDWIAETPDQYVSIATEKSKNLASLSELRSTLRDRMLNSPLMNAGRFAADMESAYRRMWHGWCE
jgi:protein O-GlcNAc transferase